MMYLWITLSVVFWQVSKHYASKAAEKRAEALDGTMLIDMYRTSRSLYDSFVNYYAGEIAELRMQSKTAKAFSAVFFMMALFSLAHNIGLV